MTHPVRIRRALVSVHDKRGVAELGRSLASRGVTLISTGGTARALADAGVPVTPIESVTRFPEMLDGRVKTLHPAIHGGLLFRRGVEGHERAAREHGIEPIDLVCVNLYPFERTVAAAGVTEEEAIEQIDIGGPSMIRSAAKNFESVAVITSPDQYAALDAELGAHDGATTLDFRRASAQAAFARTAAYDAAIAAWMAGGGGEPFPPRLRLSFERHSILRYGENPHQAGAAYLDPGSRETSVLRAAIDAGKELSYNNLLDASAALELVGDLRRLGDGAVAACIVKHTNPCGAALAGSARDAFLRAWQGDPLAAYGGIVALSGPVDAATAEVMAQGDRFLEVIVASSFEPRAKTLLAERWKSARLVAVGDLGGTIDALRLRSIPGGLLVQEPDARPESADAYRHAAGPAPTAAQRRDAAFAMTVAKHLKSNAVCIVRDGTLLGAGAGQMDRVAACRIAVEKRAAARRGDDSDTGAGTTAASDAFFPFPDGPRLLLDAGVRCLVHPGGSKRDGETFDLCNERGVTCLVSGVRHFRH